MVTPIFGIWLRLRESPLNLNFTPSQEQENNFVSDLEEKDSLEEEKEYKEEDSDIGEADSAKVEKKSKDSEEEESEEVEEADTERFIAVKKGT